MSSTPETPAPLSFDSPQVQAARTLASSLSWLKSEACLAALDVIEHAVPCNDRDSLDTHEEIGRILADALTHEHEARVKAEELVHGLQLIIEGARPLQDKLQQAEAERDRLECIVEPLLVSPPADGEEAESETTCVNCGESYALDDGADPTPECHRCAQGLLNNVRTVLAAYFQRRAALSGLPAKAGVKP